MSDEQGYNGWTNYETWVTALWIDNDQGSYEKSRALVASAQIDAADEREEWWTDEMTHNRVVSRAADFLRDWMTDAYEIVVAEMNNGHASVFGDLLGAAWSRVEWREIAANYLSEVDA